MNCQMTSQDGRNHRRMTWLLSSSGLLSTEWVSQVLLISRRKLIKDFQFTVLFLFRIINNF